MALSLGDKLTILIAHRDNLNNAKTFEEYKKLHIAYVDFLIEELMATKNVNDAIAKFANIEAKNEE